MTGKWNNYWAWDTHRYTTHNDVHPQIYNTHNDVHYTQIHNT